MSICVCAQISMRVRESRGVAGKPSPAVRSINKPRSRGIPHYITPSPAGNPRVPAIIPRGGNPAGLSREPTGSRCQICWQSQRSGSTNTQTPSLHRQTSLYPLYVRQDNISNVANVRFKNFVNLTKNSIAKTRRAAQHEKNM